MEKKQKDVGLLDVRKLSLETLVGLPKNVVYCFLDSDLRYAQVFSTVSIVQHLGRILEEIESSGEYSVLRERLKDTKIRILEVDILETDLKLRQAYWIDLYTKKGYKMYKELTPIRYNLETIVEWEGGRAEYRLYARNKRKSILLGRFRKKGELEDFLSESYPDGKVYTFLYHVSISSPTGRI